MLTAPAEVRLALRNVKPEVVEALKSKLVSENSVLADHQLRTRFVVRDGTPHVVCRFGRGVYEKAVDLDLGVAIVMNLARIVGYSAGRGRMVLEVQAGGR